MNTSSRILITTAGLMLAVAGILAVGQARVTGAEHHAGTVNDVTISIAADSKAGADGGSGSRTFHAETLVLKGIEPSDARDRETRKEVAWLGVATEEAQEALTAQLGLEPGIGLVVTHIAPDSPAAKAGLQKNDVLVELGNQWLVHPAQLRKLLQVRKPGDTVELAYFRAGKKQTISVTLAKTTAGLGALEGKPAWSSALVDLERQLRDLRLEDTAHATMKSLRDSLGHLQIDHQKVQEGLHRSLKQAQKTYEEALRHVTGPDSVLAPVRKALDDLARSKILMDNKATVTVRNTGQAVKSIVHADESGTIVIVANPKPRLTAHDKEGRLLFDGEIETAAQREQVPPDLWKKVEPLLDKLMPSAEEKPAAEPAAPKETACSPAAKGFALC